MTIMDLRSGKESGDGSGGRFARWEWQRLWRRGTPVSISGCFQFLRFFARGGTGGRGQLRRLWGEAVNVLACGWKLRTGEGLLYGLLWAGPFSPVILGYAGRDCLKLAHARDGPGLSLRIASGRIALPMSTYKNSGSGGQDARPPPPKKRVLGNGGDDFQTPTIRQRPVPIGGCGRRS